MAYYLQTGVPEVYITSVNSWPQLHNRTFGEVSFSTLSHTNQCRELQLDVWRRLTGMHHNVCSVRWCSSSRSVALVFFFPIIFDGPQPSG